MANLYKFDRSHGISSELFDYSVSPFSPVIGDVERKVSYDEEGREVVTFVPVDYKKLQKELGTADMYSLENLLKAGIDPNFGIHTGSSVSRLEGVNSIQQAASDVDALFADNNVEESK